MLTFPNFNPVLIEIGPLSVHWYGIMYLCAFMGGLWLGNWRARNQPWLGWNEEMMSDVFYYFIFGTILGGRIGYVLFYSFDTFLANPIFLFRIDQGGMSFHGGFLGVLVGLALFARKYQLKFLQIGDMIAPLVPLGLGFGRFGNFINGELWGKPTDLPWGMVFPHVDMQARHPNQLYEMFFEGIVLFVVLWLVALKPRKRGTLSALFLIGYGLIRVGIEFVRVPDEQLGYLALNFLTMGMLLSLPMVLAGLAMLFWSLKYAEVEQSTVPELAQKNAKTSSTKKKSHSKGKS